MGEARRGYSWPPFEPENSAALRHGAHSERRWRPIADALAKGAVEVAPWLTRPAFSMAVEAWAATEAKARLVDAWLDEYGLLDANGDPTPANALSDRLHTKAITMRGQLGLDPTSLARLLATFATVPGGDEALEALKSEGRRLMIARSESTASSILRPSDANRETHGPQDE